MSALLGSLKEPHARTSGPRCHKDAAASLRRTSARCSTGCASIAHMGTQNCNGYLEAPRGREDYVDPAGFRAVAGLDSLAGPDRVPARGVRAFRSRTALGAAFAAGTCLPPEPRQERRCERGTARPQVLHRDLREPVCRKMKSPRQINALGLFRELPATAGNPITCCRSIHGNRVQVLVAQRSVPLELRPFPNPFPTGNEQSHAGSERLTPDLDH